MFESIHVQNFWGTIFPATLILVVVIGMFVLAAIAMWTKQRRRERSSLYDHELAQRLAERGELTEEGALEMVREQAAEEYRRRREGMRVGGIVSVAAGFGILVFFNQIEPDMVAAGYVPILVGVALLIATFLPRPKG